MGRVEKFVQVIIMKNNRLIIIGNGFDLANGLKTKYSDFIDWLLCDSYSRYNENHHFENNCFYWGHNGSDAFNYIKDGTPITGKVVVDFVKKYSASFNIKNSFLNFLLTEYYTEERWIDIENHYFKRLLKFFTEKYNPAIMNDESNHKNRIIKKVSELNTELEYLGKRLEDYLMVINSRMSETQFPYNPRANINNILSLDEESKIMYLNFNYTDTLIKKGYACESELNYIHGRLGFKENPIVFGYGDENTSEIQQLEHAGVNEYIRKLKSFSYFKTPNYKALLSFIDAQKFEVSIIGHSCGITDRALLKEIFEHRNCTGIRVFFYEKTNGTDSFDETVLEISRHFSDKQLMRRRVINKQQMDFIPQIPGKIDI